MKIVRCFISIALVLILTFSVHANYVIPTCNTLEELYEHQSKCDNLPQPFVGYDSLQTFGEFDRYQYVIGTYTSGTYFLSDTNGHEIYIAIGYPGHRSFKSRKLLYLSNPLTDMRTLPSGESGIVCRNKINYIYLNGALSSISWNIADINFTLVMDRDKGAYPLDAEPTPITRLLSTDKDTAYSVVEEIADSIDPDGSYRAAYEKKICVKIIAAVLIIPSPIVVALFVLHLRAKKRKSGSDTNPPRHPRGG